MNMEIQMPSQGKAEPIPAELITAAIADAKSSRRRVLEVLEERLAIPTDQFVLRLGKTLHYPVLTMEHLRTLQPIFDRVPYTIASQRNCLALSNAQGELILAVSDPFNDDLMAWGQAVMRGPFAVHLAHASDIAAYLVKCEGDLRAIDGALPQAAGPKDAMVKLDDLSLQSIAEDSSPVIRLVNSSLYDALQAGASDIHLETHPTGTTIKYRIDGVLSNVANIADMAMAEQAISRLKVMAELDISEKRIPQDGRFRATIKGREVDFRVSIMPCIFGEDAVLRILDRKSLADQVQGLSLESLGFDQKTRRIMRRFAKEPYGMVLVTGPTGSGKTTTLYALITEINHGRDKIITIEDPVEYQLPGVTQIPVNEKKGLTFAKGLRSILRHDPDKILVGEIRDPDTAQIAVQSALTGHLVFTTVHANNVFDVIGRFMHMGVDTYSFVSALNGILAQRLVRVVCSHCAAPHTPDEELLQESGIPIADAVQYQFVEGLGCGHCRGTGYKGRKAIAEFLHLNDEIRQLIVAREPIQVIKAAACRHGTQLLREAALELVKSGETSLEEVNRVTFVA